MLHIICSDREKRDRELEEDRDKERGEKFQGNSYIMKSSIYNVSYMIWFKG